MIRPVCAALAVIALAAPAVAQASPGWATPVSTLATSAFPGQPHLASDSRGDTVVAWSDSSGNVFESERPAGGSFTPATQVSTATGQAFGSIAIDNSGLIYVFFVTGEGTSGSKPNVATKPIGGTAWTVTPLAGASSSDSPQAPLVGAVTPSGKAIAVWYQGHTAGNERSSFQYATKAAGTSTWSGKATVNNTGYQGNFTSPSSPVLAVDPAGDAALAFTRYDGNFINNIVWGTTLTTGAANWTSANPIMADVGSDTLVAGPVVAIAPDGTATAAWVRNNNAPNNIVQFATKSLSATSWPAAPSGDKVTPGANDLSPLGADASQPAVAVEPDGTTTVAWTQGNTLTERTRPGGAGAFNSARSLPSSLTFPASLALIASPDGGMFALWAGQNADGNQVISAARRSVGATTFATLPNLPGTGNEEPAGAADDQGNVATAWVNSSSGQFSQQATGLVVGAPTISNVSFPSAATQGAPFAYGATVTDRWVTPTSSWSFGDNTTGPLGGTKTYAGIGPFTAVLTATDPFGNVASISRSVTVSAPPVVDAGGSGAASGSAGAGSGAGSGAASGAGSPMAPTPIATAATISGLHQSARAWREGRKFTAFAGKHKPPVGTTFTFTLNVPATVQLSFTRAGAGRAVGGRCLAETKGNRKHHKCALIAGTLSQPAHAGVNTLTFQGRLSRGKRLAPGTYTLVLTAIGSSGHVSAPQTIKFTIVRG